MGGWGATPSSSQAFALRGDAARAGRDATANGAPAGRSVYGPTPRRRPHARACGLRYLRELRRVAALGEGSAL